MLTCSSEVSLAVPVCLEITVDGSYHHKMPDIKFSTVIEKRISNVRLHNCSFRLTICMILLLQQFSRNIIRPQNLYPCTSIRTLPRFNNPQTPLINLFLILNKKIVSLIIIIFKMISFWYDLKRISFLYVSVVVLHCIE